MALSLLCVASTLIFPVPAASVQAELQPLWQDFSQLPPGMCDRVPGACSFGQGGLDCVTCRVRRIWDRAVWEAGLEPGSISNYGKTVPKIPKSWVARISRLNHTKRHRFNFVGDLYKHPPKCCVRHDTARKRREWVEVFADANFDASDVLNETDRYRQYTHTLPKNSSSWTRYDPVYFGTMASSNFTLAPGGDIRWTMRFYEAIAAGSLPIMYADDFAEDRRPANCVRSIGYKYVEPNATLKYREDWVEENYRRFIKYQTFIEGDNVPAGQECVPADPPPRKKPRVTVLVYSHSTAKVSLGRAVLLLQLALLSVGLPHSQ